MPKSKIRQLNPSDPSVKIWCPCCKGRFTLVQIEQHFGNHRREMTFEEFKLLIKERFEVGTLRYTATHHDPRPPLSATGRLQKAKQKRGMSSSDEPQILSGGAFEQGRRR